VPRQRARRPPEPATPEARVELERRARMLAAHDGVSRHASHDAPQPANDGVHATLPMLVARRGGAVFAMRAIDLRDVRRHARVTVLPGAEPPVTGLVAWRGRGLVVHDVLPGEPLVAAPGGTLAPWLLVVGEIGEELALLVDDVDDFVELPLSTLLPTPDGTPPAHGVTTDGVLVLDLRGWLALHSHP